MFGVVLHILCLHGALKLLFQTFELQSSGKYQQCLEFDQYRRHEPM